MTVAPGTSFGLRLVEAFAWGVLGGIALAATAFISELAAERLHALNPSHSMSLLIYVPLGLIGGFLLSAGARLVRPRWTAAQMCIAIATLVLLCAVAILQLGKIDAWYEHQGR